MKVILISGKAQHGKDTVAALIRDTLKSDNHKVLTTHYADLLKYICQAYFDWDGNKDEKGRQMLQYVGTDVIRQKNPTMWVDFVAMILKYFHDHWDYVIIPDCRFPNEVTTMIQEGFDTMHLRVVRPGFKSSLTEAQQNHPSETALDNMPPDFFIENKGTLEELKSEIINWVKENLYEH